jgi:hypothetical protein
VGAVIEAMGEALRAVHPGDILGWFGHSGYPTTRSTVTVERKPHQFAVVTRMVLLTCLRTHRQITMSRNDLDTSSHGVRLPVCIDR